MRLLYSFNKTGYEAEFWTKEIAAASSGELTFIPFNHGTYLDSERYVRAQLLDNLYYYQDRGLMRLYAEISALLDAQQVDVLLVDNCHPYHPDWLRSKSVYKVLRTSDGPMAAYDRDFAYLHAYDHVLYHSPAYSKDLDMPAKLQYVGSKHHDFWPLGLFDAAYDTAKDEAALFGKERDIDVLFIGALHLDKMPLLAKVKKALGRRCVLRGISSLKRNVYFNLKYGFPCWIRPVAFEDYVPLYERTKIGFNVHNRGKFTVGGYRLFELPANGALQISDGGEYLESFFDVGREVVAYESADELIDKIRYYLVNEDERIEIARRGHRRVIRDYRFKALMHCMAAAVAGGRERLDQVRYLAEARADPRYA